MCRSKDLLWFFPQNEVADVKEMYSILKREKAELEKELAHIRGVCEHECMTVSNSQTLYFTG